MLKKVTRCYPVFSLSLEFGKICLDGLVEVEASCVDQVHYGGGGRDDFGERGKIIDCTVWVRRPTFGRPGKVPVALAEENRIGRSDDDDGSRINAAPYSLVDRAVHLCHSHHLCEQQSKRGHGRTSLWRVGVPSVKHMAMRYGSSSGTDQCSMSLTPSKPIDRTAASPSKPGATSAAMALAVMLGALGGIDHAHAQAIPIDTLALRGHSYYLAHDLLEGRDTGSAGAKLAAVYLASVCQSLGLQPLGSSYFQTIPLAKALILPETSLRVATGQGGFAVSYPHIVPPLGSARTLMDFHGPAFYLGLAERVESGLPVELDLHNAIAITLGTLRSAGADTLLRRGAVGLVQLIPDTAAFESLRERLGDWRLYHADSTIASSYFPRLPSVVAGPSATQALAQAGRLDAGDRGPLRLDLEITVRIATQRIPTVDRNVMCLLQGRGGPAADSLIVFTAHYDHLGVGPADAEGDSIYNGFSDNAAGVSMLLALAQAFSRETATRFRHSVLFLFPTGEERGFLGSDFYVTHAPWPLDRTVAIITLDAGAPPAPPTSWELAGGDGTALGDVGMRVAAERGWAATTSPARPISDFYPFVRRGAPGVLIIPGPAPYEGLSIDSSASLRRQWDHYHRPADEWSAAFPLNGLRRFAEYAGLIAQAIDRDGLGRPDR